ncbi:MAG: hypothetical protein WAU15_05960 [Nitrosomonas sp.]
MNLLKTVVIVSLVAFISSPVFATETLEEKKEAVTNDVKRTATKSVNRVEEATCMDSDAKCLALKAKNRIEEAGAATKDKAIELKNKLD